MTYPFIQTNILKGVPMSDKIAIAIVAMALVAFVVAIVMLVMIRRGEFWKWAEGIEDISFWGNRNRRTGRRSRR
jgi:ABC-type microcin C transport system permease subunit YejB